MGRTLAQRPPRCNGTGGRVLTGPRAALIRSGPHTPNRGPGTMDAPARTGKGDRHVARLAAARGRNEGPRPVGRPVLREGRSVHRLRAQARARPVREPGEGPERRVGHAQQPRAVQLLHHEDGQGRHRRLPQGVDGPLRRRGGLHRRRRQGVLHGREHEGVRRVLLEPPERVRQLHGPVQRDDRRHPRLQEADDLPRERHARRGRPGDRHGVRPDAVRSSGRRAPGTAPRPTAARPTSSRGSSGSRTRCGVASPARCGAPTR